MFLRTDIGELSTFLQSTETVGRSFIILFDVLQLNYVSACIVFKTFYVRTFGFTYHDCLTELSEVEISNQNCIPCGLRLAVVSSFNPRSDQTALGR